MIRATIAANTASSAEHNLPMVQPAGQVEVDGRVVGLDAPPKPIPNLWIGLKGLYGGEEFQIKAVPDSGAMMLMISLHILKRNKVPLNISRVGYNVKDVQKNCVPHQGQADLEVSGNRVKTAIRVLASDNIEDNMLISYQDLTYTVSADIMESIKHNFSDVMNDRLNPVPMKTDKPMLINLKENAKPLKVLAARRVPKRYEEPAEAAIEDLIKKGVLKRVSDVTDWGSPGFFIAKSDGRVRLVTDFTHLNRYVNRPVHPFPSTRDILQAIPHDAI